MGLVVAVVTPDATEAGRARGVDLPQLAHERVVERPSRDLGVLAAVDHQLLPDAQARGVALRQGARLCELLPGALAYTDPLERQQRSWQHRAELRHEPGDAPAVPHRDDHERDRRVAPEELGALPDAMSGAIDAEEDSRAGDTPRVEERDDGFV